MVAITTKYLSQTVFSSLSFCLMPNFPMIGNQSEMGAEKRVLVVVTAMLRSVWSLWLVTVRLSLTQEEEKLLTLNTALPFQPPLILSESLSPFFGPSKILVEAFICLKSYRRTVWALSLVDIQVSSIKIRTVITKYQRGQQIFRLIFSNLNKVDIYNPLLFST